VDITYFADCAARSFFDQVANKWSVMILTILAERPTRFNAMMRRLEGITHKALTQALRRLERNGLIERRVIATSPVAVEYSISDLGRTLQVPSQRSTTGRSTTSTTSRRPGENSMQRPAPKQEARREKFLGATPMRCPFDRVAGRKHASRSPR